MVTEKMAISQKWGKIQPKLLLITMPCQIRWKSLTLDDLEGH